MPTKYENLFNNILDISQHTDLGDYYTLLGERKGYCYGLVMMWGQAVLARDEETFYKRLGLLTTEYPPGNRLSDRINEIIEIDRYRYNPTGLDSIYVQACIPDYTLLRTIRAFLDGLLMYQRPDNACIDTNIMWQTPLPSIYVGNEKITVSTHKPYYASESVRKKRKTGCLSHESYDASKPDITYIKNRVLTRIFHRVNTYFNAATLANLIEAIWLESRSRTEPFFVHLASERHSTGFKFSNDIMEIFEPNHLTSSRLEESIPQELFMRYRVKSNILSLRNQNPSGTKSHDDPISIFRIVHLLLFPCFYSVMTPKYNNPQPGYLELEITIFNKPGKYDPARIHPRIDQIMAYFTEISIHRIIIKLNEYISSGECINEQRVRNAINELRRITKIRFLANWLKNEEYSFRRNHMTPGYRLQHYGIRSPQDIGALRYYGIIESWNQSINNIYNPLAEPWY